MSFDPAFVSGVLERFTAVSSKSSTADILELSEIWGKEDADKARFILDFLSVLHRGHDDVSRNRQKDRSRQRRSR